MSLFAKANEEKSGDHLAGIAARSERERVAAKRELADLPLAEIAARPLIDPDQDDVSRLLLETYDRDAFREIASLTVGEFRELLLDDATGATDLRRVGRAIIPEIAAAVAKIMSNKDLILAAGKDSQRDTLQEHDGRERRVWEFERSRTTRRMTSAGFCFRRLRACFTAVATR